MKKLISILISAFILLIFPTFALGAGTLGIGVSILPSGDQGGADLGNNSQLWFSMKPGDVLSREFTVSSSANINQKISFQLIGLQTIDGVERSKPEQIAEASKWAQFSPSELILKPQSNSRVKLTFTIPNGTDYGKYDGYLHVVAEASDASILKSKSKVQAVIKNAVAFDQKFWLGVGDGKFLATDFEMKSIRGIIRGEKKFIQIEMKNLGGTPIGPEGTIDLQDAVFAKNHIGPVTFGTATVLPGKSRWAEAEVPFETPDGKWKVFVTANQGNITKTKMFESDIKFVDESSGFNFPWQTILIIGFAFLLLFGIRLLKTPGKAAIKGVKRVAGAENNKTSDSKLDLSSLSLEELEAILSSRLGEKPKAKKKAAARKPASKTVRKKAAKKAPVKKSAKSAPKKAAKKPAKKSAKKAPAKRSTGRK